MRFSHASAALVLAGSALALPKHECLVGNSKDLAAYADCGHEGAIAYCLGQLQDAAASDVAACYTKAGCSADEAAIEARYTLDRCEALGRTGGDLRKRYRGIVMRQADDATTAADAPAADAKTTDDAANPFGAKTGTDCFTTGKKSTTECPLSTSDGKVRTVTCFPTEVSTSKCAPGLLCTLDSSNNDVCMEAQTGLDTSGIVIVIVFGVVLALGIGSLTFLCCKDRKEQRRLTAKAEAVALARAATKKQRAQDRAPLMRNVSGGIAGNGNHNNNNNNNPFQDQPRL